MSEAICQHLRTKKMYVPAQADQVMEQLAAGDNRPLCWCNCTLRELGVDDQPVGAAVCQPGRSCYQA
jgi:hypothetical protein